MAAESPMWTLFVKKGDGNTASVIERREVFMVSRACIDKPSNCSFLRSCHYICHPSKPNQQLMAFSLIIREMEGYDDRPVGHTIKNTYYHMTHHT